MKLFARSALLDAQWAADVVFDIGADGLIDGVERDVGRAPAGAVTAQGVVVPGMVNAHSHAFQRAMAGLAERRGGDGDDDFWSWRRIMYAFVRRLTPPQCQRIAEQLYIEMLQAGFTSVAEFHYLHHRPDGAAYEPPTEMAERLLEAAAGAGIGLALLPVLYSYGGFAGAPPGAEQSRFVNDVDAFVRGLRLLHERCAGRTGVRIGVALHSLRAVAPEQIGVAVDALRDLDACAPVHIHIAEQQREVEECLAWSGRRPVEWLLENVDVDQRWCLVHATHLSDTELERLAASGAVVGLCPTTEANLGDGLFPAPAYLEAGGAIAVGSDSNITVSPVQELRMLEYGQRLLQRRRAVLGDAPHASVGATLYRRALAGGAQALALPCGRLAPGCRADLVVLDPECAALAGRRGDVLLDAWVFAGDARAVRDVMVGGRWVIRDGRHDREEPVREQFARTLTELA